ncbi:FKBP-type peptidyl-prolyl cis-trans isomerase [Dethiosulfatarculus sandiegensis]|uniref:Peptidyl-prolyl cis-trans isomerase n=1 Tax=Dethiosulfatarculus sandiegensis TaxID=1429043 RepID=A0A0D2HYI8_9BACT|nr:FKBP-type peptidyl-prolyl cis-trans isomerase [Dethiosulfatarculus sandiegensis]KIX15373.1 membrane protein [Dethiosulfatarculus sandiegensis]
MRSVFLAVLAIVFSALPLFAEADLKLSDNNAKISYALGVDLARGMLEDGFKVNQKAFAKGFADGLADKKIILTDDEIDLALEAFQLSLLKRQEISFKQESAGNKIAGDRFRQNYALGTGVKKLDGGLLYRVLKMGSGPTPTLTDEVTVHYEGRLVDGTVFESSYEQNEPVPFFMEDVIQGWQIALEKMRTGDKWEVVVPPEKAYGKAGDPPVIGPESTLVFIIELINVQDPEAFLPKDEVGAGKKGDD